MDPFTEHMLKKAEQRSRALGISNTPSSKCTTNALHGAYYYQQKEQEQQQQIQKENHFLTKTIDSDIDTNVVADKGIQVQLSNEDKNSNYDDDGYDDDNDDDNDNDDDDSAKACNNNDSYNIPKLHKYQQLQQSQQKLHYLSDTSRERLQRLAEFYSNILESEDTIDNDVNNDNHNGDYCHNNSKSMIELELEKNQRLEELATLDATTNQWENNTNDQQQQQQGRDPSELPLKQRIKLFENQKDENKFRIKEAPYRSDCNSPLFIHNGKSYQSNQSSLKQWQHLITNYPAIKLNASNKVREKVAEILNVSNVNRNMDAEGPQRKENIESNRINKHDEEISASRQREQEQNVLLNVWSCSKNMMVTPLSSPLTSPSPSPSPSSCIDYTKRKLSEEKRADDDDEMRRARKCHRAPLDLHGPYNLSDIDSNKLNDKCSDCPITNDYPLTVRLVVTVDDMDDTTKIGNISVNGEKVELVGGEEDVHSISYQYQKNVAQKEPEQEKKEEKFQKVLENSDLKVTNALIDSSLDDEESDISNLSDSSTIRKPLTEMPLNNTMPTTSTTNNALRSNTANVSPSSQTSSSSQMLSISFKSKEMSNKENGEMAAIQSIRSSQTQENINGGNLIVMHEASKQNSLEDDIGVKDKIRRFLYELQKQKQLIKRISKALNVCAYNTECTDSINKVVEGERYLLLATHRYQAYLNALQRLTMNKKASDFSMLQPEKGNLTIKQITLTLRSDYLELLRLNKLPRCHLVCLVKYKGNVLATKYATTAFNTHVKFSDILHVNGIDDNFKVTIEIYGMAAQGKEKYCTKLCKKFGIMMPKKEDLIITPGPYITRKPALIKYGSVVFSKEDIKCTNWSLTRTLQTPANTSPLKGTVHMKLNFQLTILVKYKGFLTIFEDASEFGNWHRRWCYLNGSIIKYWKHACDEAIKPPIGLIDLHNCCSTKLTLVPQRICKRLNTILLECERPAKQNDKQSVTIIPNGSTIIERYLLSADTEKQLKEWCACLNKALT